MEVNKGLYREDKSSVYIQLIDYGHSYQPIYFRV